MTNQLTDEEWRDYQSIPDQGYSHRGWVDHKIEGRIKAATPAIRAQAYREAATQLQYMLNGGGHGKILVWALLDKADEIEKDTTP